MAQPPSFGQKYEEPPKIPLTNVKPQYMPPNAPKPMVDLQVYQPMQPKNQPPKTINPAMYVPTSLPVAGPGYPPQFNPYWPQYTPQLVSPVIKQYSINNAPFLETTTLKMGSIREDILPSQLTTNTTNSLGERLNIHNFIRSVFIKTYDGEDIDIDGQGANSILRYLKFLELNPYCPETNIENPYMGMPADMLLYRSCYPIKYDEKTNSLQCSPNSLGMNVRIYTLSFAEYNIKKIDNHDFYEYDVWRELAYYEYIRENILKKKVCPNFILMHCYYISENCNIDKNKVLLLKGKSSKRFGPYILFLIRQLNIYKDQLLKTKNHLIANVPPFITQKNIMWFKQEMAILQTRYRELRNLELSINEKQQFQKTEKLFVDIKTELDALLKLFQSKTNLQNNVNNNNNDILDVKMNSGKFNSPLTQTLYDFSGKGLVTMTESPTYNFYDWASVKYEAQGNIHRMINTGFHTTDVWMSVLFQIMVGLYVLQKYRIVFRDFSIGDNIYIKDISEHNNIKKYWKYIIGSYEYYVPNYGYLVLFDTNYKDIEEPVNTLIPNKNNKQQYKIYSNIFEDGVYDDTQLYDQAFGAFVNTFSTNNLGATFSIGGGSAIPDDIRQLFGRITSDISKPNISNDIGMHIQKYMRCFMNNRVGTLLARETEGKFIEKIKTDPFNEGEVICQEISHDTFVFVIYVGDDPVNVGSKLILTKNNPNDKEVILRDKIDITTLKHYSQYETITQTFKAGEVTFSEDNLIETYIC